MRFLILKKYADISHMKLFKIIILFKFFQDYMPSIFAFRYLKHSDVIKLI